MDRDDYLQPILVSCHPGTTHQPGLIKHKCIAPPRDPRLTSPVSEKLHGPYHSKLNHQCVMFFRQTSQKNK